MEPTTPTVLFGYFDIFLLSLIVLFNVLIWKYNIVKAVNWKVMVLRFAILFIIFPMLSTKVEVANVYRKFEIVDGFNLLYIWFRWPTWWLIGLFEIFAFNSIINKKKRHKPHETAPNPSLPK
jgi:hypothetical protein